MTAQARLVEAYERVRWPRRAPSLPELLTCLMDQHGLSRADLVPLLGTLSGVGEVMTGKRELSMSMVRKLRERFHISADLLISPTGAGGWRLEKIDAVNESAFATGAEGYGLGLLGALA